MTPLLTLLADLLVAVLLVATILSSLGLSRRITQLKADESAMRRTIGELVLASETAERAIAGLRTTLGECDRTLAERLRTAERYAADLAGQVEAGEAVMERISRIVDSSRQVSGQAPVPALPEARPRPASPVELRAVPRPREEDAPRPLPDPLDATVAAAQAFAERVARRSGEWAT